ncbi:hypothetical protein BDF20DRAFT_826233 [Mycotypha africana]|uniref:uncharacterized protein n=1 Tax=Mycotypha africana TaxID=64632 RepID=UPI00230003A4|nr:uncharacterized protein BDF20DRAFT_826233 [Mycotypha africana]KAI8969961.1 hypothetical protein BDF20DRAFT_826233 [Mycotypha africana]
MLTKSVSRAPFRSFRLTSKRYTTYQSGSEGATASSGQFGQKERAIENQWARSHDADKIKMLREALAKQEKNTEAIKKDLEALEKKHQQTK